MSKFSVLLIRTSANNLHSTVLSVKQTTGGVRSASLNNFGKFDRPWLTIVSQGQRDFQDLVGIDIGIDIRRGTRWLDCICKVDGRAMYAFPALRPIAIQQLQHTGTLQLLPPWHFHFRSQRQTQTRGNPSHQNPKRNHQQPHRPCETSSFHLKNYKIC